MIVPALKTNVVALPAITLLILLQPQGEVFEIDRRFT